MRRYSRNRYSERYAIRRPLSEAQINLTDDEIWGRSDFSLRKANKRSQDAEKARIQAEREAKQREENIKKAQKYFDIMESQNASDALDSLFELLVPRSGKAETVAGEVIRAVAKIGHRWHNDGDYWMMGYGVETCGEAISYLMDNFREIDKYLETWLREYQDKSDSIVYNYFNYQDPLGKDYEARLERLYEVVIDYFKNHPEAFVDVNDDDMLKSNLAYDELTAEYDWQIDYDLSNLLDEGYISKDDILEELFGWRYFDSEPYIEFDNVRVDDAKVDDIAQIHEIMENSDYGHTVYEQWIKDNGNPYDEDDEEEDEYDEEEDETLEEDLTHLTEKVKSEMTLKDNRTVFGYWGEHFWSYISVTVDTDWFEAHNSQDMNAKQLEKLAREDKEHSHVESMISWFGD